MKRDPVRSLPAQLPQAQGMQNSCHLMAGKPQDQTRQHPPWEKQQSRPEGGGMPQRGHPGPRRTRGRGRNRHGMCRDFDSATSRVAPQRCPQPRQVELDGTLQQGRELLWEQPVASSCLAPACNAPFERSLSTMLYTPAETAGQHYLSEPRKITTRVEAVAMQTDPCPSPGQAARDPTDTAYLDHFRVSFRLPSQQVLGFLEPPSLVLVYHWKGRHPWA